MPIRAFCKKNTNNRGTFGKKKSTPTVEKIAAASKARGPGGKARAFGKLAGDAALGRLSNGYVRLGDFKGSALTIAKRLGRNAISTGLSQATGGALDYNSAYQVYKQPTDVKSYTKIGGALLKNQVRAHSRKLLLGGGS
jgi:hypothetical protein